MSQLNTSLSERRRKEKAAKSGKRIKLAVGDLPKSCDALFIGLQAHVGEVVTLASPEGRAAVEKIFPDARIEWREPRVNPGEAFPSDWQEFNFVLPGLLAARPQIRVVVPDHLLKLKSVDKMSADQFACLMMFAASEQGVRAAMFSEFSQEITLNIPKNCNN
jgi:hypothetical protein